MIEVRRYTEGDAQAWNTFVERARNATFLFDRRYMDYHSDRFADHSLLVYRRGRLLALFPANSSGRVVYSHQGLTYGGLVTDQQATTALVQDIFRAINDYYRKERFERVVYKALPWIYHDYPSEEALYALTSVCQAHLKSRAVGTAMPLHGHLPFTEARKSGLRKARRAGLQVAQCNDIETFWHILDDNLWRSHGAHPVHTLEELCLLAQRFPQNIALYMATLDNVPVGGVLLYLSRQVVHTQYISATEQGKRVGAIDAIFEHLLSEDYAQRFFDFGTSVIGSTCELNEPLIFQKEGFGGRAVCYDVYEWELWKLRTER